MERKEKIALIAAIVIVIAVGIGGIWFLLKDTSRTSTPESTVWTFYRAFNKENADQAYKLFSDEVRENHSKSEMRNYIAPPVKVTELNKLRKRKMKDRAWIVVRTRYTTPVENAEFVENIPLVRVDGSWLIDEWPTEWVNREQLKE